MNDTWGGRPKIISSFMRQEGIDKNVDYVYFEDKITEIVLGFSFIKRETTFHNYETKNRIIEYLKKTYKYYLNK